MAKLDAISPREYTDRNGEKRTTWVRVGAAFDGQGGITVILDCIPLPGPDGSVKIMLREPRQQDAPAGRPQHGGRAPAQQHSHGDLDDDIPF